MQKHQKEDLINGWSAFLSYIQWDWFVTVTFRREQRSAEGALRAANWIFKQSNAQRGVFFAEKHHLRADIYHIHGLLWWQFHDLRPEVELFGHILWGKFGFNKVVPIKKTAESIDKVTKYVAKYCAKEADTWALYGKKKWWKGVENVWPYFQQSSAEQSNLPEASSVNEDSLLQSLPLPLWGHHPRRRKSLGPPPGGAGAGGAVGLPSDNAT